MKKTVLYISFLMLMSPVMGQVNTSPNPYPKTITVSGSAEMEIIPDQIYVTIELREYQKRGEAKKDLETIKTAFLDACKASSIADSMVSISSYTGFNNYYYFKKGKKDPDLMAGIIYQVIFSNSKQMDQLVEKLDDEATRSFQISGTSHSKMSEFRKLLKIQAIKAAKDKGIYLTEAIGEKLGPAVTIMEPDESGNRTYLGSNGFVNVSNAVSQARIEYRDSYKEMDKTEVAFKKIKLRYEVTVIFSL